MKTKIKRHSRSALSILLTLCMLVSCMTVGLIATDAASVTEDESVGATAAVLSLVNQSGGSNITVNLSDSGSSNAQTFEPNTDHKYKIRLRIGSKTYYQNFNNTGDYEIGSNADNWFKTYNTSQDAHSGKFTKAKYKVYFKDNDDSQVHIYFVEVVAPKYQVSASVSGTGGEVASDKALAEEDDTVTITATPERGKVLDTISSDPSVTFFGSGNKRTFTMPASAVEVQVTFTDAGAHTINITGSSTDGNGDGNVTVTLKAGSKVVATKTIYGVSDSASITAYDGEVLTVTTSPASGSERDGITINGAAATTLNITSSTPDAVSVVGSFKKQTTHYNEVDAVPGTSITGNSDIYYKIKSTFYDYFTDSEVAGNWYTSIKTKEEGWVGHASDFSDITRNPYKIFNSALSEYNKQNTATNWPIYWGSFYDVSYHDPGYYNSASGDTYHGEKLNDSNSLSDNDNTNALPGIVATELNGGAAGTIQYASGEDMPMFDKAWLTGSATSRPTNYTLNVNNKWDNYQCDIYAVFRKSFTSQTDYDEYWVKMTKTGSNWNSTYTVEAPYNYSYEYIVFARWDQNNPPQTGHQTSVNNWGNGGKWNDATTSLPTNGGTTFKLTSTNAGTWEGSGYNYSGPLAQIVNAPFPVKKYTNYNGTGIEYYKFSSTDGADNVYFKKESDHKHFTYDANGNLEINYGGKDRAIKNGYNSDEGFFPFDDKDAYNGYGKDLGLGLRLEIKFTLGKDGKILKDGGNPDNPSDYVHQTFDFSGDDDLWVYVDGHLILDLGGDHKKSIGTIDFADRKVYRTGTTNSVWADNTLDNTRNKSFASLVDNTNPKTQHTMVIYYTERGIHESNLEFGFSFSPIDNYMEVEKEVDATNVNEGIRSAVIADTAGDFSFVVTDGDKGKNAKYTLYNGESDHTGTAGTTNASTGAFSVDHGKYASFRNIFAVKDNMSVAETINSAYSFGTAYKVIDREVAEGDSGIDNLITAGSGNDTGTFKYQTIKPNSDPDMDSSTLRAIFTNTVKTKTLFITKDIDNTTDTDAVFSISVGVKVGSTTLDTSSLKYFTSDDPDNEKTFVNGTATIHQTETLTIPGLPEGAEITVTENTPLPADFSYVGVSNVETTANGSMASAGKLTLNKNDVVTVINHKALKASFSITKAINNALVTADDTFKIHVQVSDDGTDGTWSDLANAEFKSSNLTRGTNSDGYDVLDDYGKTNIHKDETLSFTEAVYQGKYIRIVEDTTLIPADTQYTGFAAVKHTGGESIAYTTVGSDSDNERGGSFVVEEDFDATITNALRTGNITITKSTTGLYDSSAVFRIRIQTSTDGNTWTDYHEDIASTVVTSTGRVATQITTGVYEYSIQKGEILSLNLSPRTYVRVMENRTAGSGADNDPYNINNDYTYNSTFVSEAGDSTSAPNKGTDYIDATNHYYGTTYCVTQKAAVVTINNDPILYDITVVKSTDFKFDDGSKFEMHCEFNAPYDEASYRDNNEGYVKVVSTDTAAQLDPKPNYGKYKIQKDGSITFYGIPKGSYFRVTEETPIGASDVTGVDRFAFDRMTLSSGEFDDSKTEQSNGRYFMVDADKTVTVHNKIKKKTVNIKKQLSGGEGDPTVGHTVTVWAYKNGPGSEAYGHDYAIGAGNPGYADDRIAYTSSLDTANPQTVHYLSSGDTLTIHGNEIITFDRSTVYVGSFFKVEETVVGNDFEFNSIDVDRYLNPESAEQFPTGLPTGFDTAGKTKVVADQYVQFQMIDYNTTVTITNKEAAKYRYNIVYNYEGYTKITYNDYVDKNPDNRKTGPARSYTVDEEISKTELERYFNIDATTKALSFKTDNLKKEFVSNKAPYEDDFMLELKWDGAVTDSYTAEKKTIFMVTTAAKTDKSKVYAYFKLPYAVTNSTTLAAADGAAKITPETHTLETYYGNWVTTNGEYQNEENAAFVTAPMTLTEGGKTLYFQYWQITSDATTSAKRNLSVDNKRCYYHQFNMTMYQDNVIEPVYAETPSDLTPRERSYEYNKGGVAKIDFIENSRNQWNADGAPDESTDVRRTAGDRIYSDFLLTFDYKDIKLQTNPTSEKIQAGFAFERVAGLDVDPTDSTKYVTKKQSEYHSANASTEASGKTAVENCAKNGVRASGNVLFIQNIDLTDLDNKNQMKYSFNITNKAYSTLAESENKNYVYRAYSYLKITNGSTTKVVVSDPVYFTIYDMATINPGQTI